MQRKRKIEVFSAGCPACEETISLVNSIACSSCDVEVLDMRQPEVASRAKRYGVSRVPAVVVDGQLAECCKGPEVNEEALRSAGVGIAP
jgi:glutaredoxin